MRADARKATGLGATALGKGTTANGENSHAVNQSHAGGYASHAEGSAYATGYISHAEGATTQASGTFSHAEGMNSQASGTNSHAQGDSTRASGDGSHAEGSGTTASGADSHAEGHSTKALAPHSHAAGYQSEARATLSHAEGQGAIASRYSQHAKSSGLLAALGDAQACNMVLRRITTDATPSMLAATSTSGVITLTGTDISVLTLPTSRAFQLKISTVARRTDVQGEMAGWTWEGLVGRDSTGNARIIGAPVQAAWGDAPATDLWDVAVSINTTDAANNYVAVTATGEAAKTIRWVAKMEWVEVGG